MASLLSPRRTDPDIALHATVPLEGRAQPPVDTALPRMASWAAALGGGLAAALVGWLLVVGVTVVGWLAADPGSFAGAVGVGSQLWLLANGAGGRLGATSVTLVPWGVTLLLMVLVSRFAAFAARQGRGRPAADVRAVVGLSTLGYAIPVVGAALALGAPAQGLRALLAVAVVVGSATAWGACRALRYDPTAGWPTWCRALLRSVAAAQLALVGSGAVALVVALLLHLHRVAALATSLHAGVVGGIALWLAQAAYLPTAVVWATSYVLGAGFTVGPGSVVALTSTQLGLLPAIPLLGALPAVGPGRTAGFCWLLAGVVAGALAAWLVSQARPAARCDVSCLLGGLAGVLSGAVFVLVAWACSGALGELRLAGLGPRLLPLLFMAATVLGLSGMLTGLVLGLLRRRSR